jgi:hypothetical protein
MRKTVIALTMLTNIFMNASAFAFTDDEWTSTIRKLITDLETATKLNTEYRDKACIVATQRQEACKKMFAGLLAQRNSQKAYLEVLLNIANFEPNDRALANELFPGDKYNAQKGEVDSLWLKLMAQFPLHAAKK